MANNIPTAKEFLKNSLHGWSEKQLEDFLSTFPGNELQNAMLLHTKLHVEAALKAASEVKFKSSSRNYSVEHTEQAKDSILNAYPIENIK